MIIVSVRCEVEAAPDAPPTAPRMNHAPPLELEVTLSVDTLSYTHVSCLCPSEVTILGDPKAATTSAPDIPTLISRCTVPTEIRFALSSLTSARCFDAGAQAPNTNTAHTIHTYLCAMTTSLHVDNV